MIGDSSFLGLGDAPGGGLFPLLANGLIDPALLLKYIQMLQGNNEGGSILDAAHQKILGQFLGDRQGGSLFGGGDAGIAARDQEMMGRGVAPATVGGIIQAGMNAVGALRGAISPTGLIGLGMTATGTRPKGIVGSLFGGDIQDIPGRTPYDRDLAAAVASGAMHRSTATQMQLDRNERRQRERFQTADDVTARGQRGIGMGGGGGYNSGGNVAEHGFGSSHGEKI